MKIKQPREIRTDDDTSHFDCGVTALNDWVKRSAALNEIRGASRTFVCTTKSGSGERERVVGFYSLATFSVQRAVARGRLSRNMPDPIPAILIARLAVDKTQQGTGLGRRLLRDAVMKALYISTLVGCRAIVVHAKDRKAASFYERAGFTPFAGDPLVLYLALQDVVDAAQHQARIRKGRS